MKGETSNPKSIKVYTYHDNSRWSSKVEIFRTRISSISIEKANTAYKGWVGFNIHFMKNDPLFE